MQPSRDMDSVLRRVADAPPRAPPRRLQPGAVLGDRFVIEGLAATGGMGAVYRAADRHTRAPAAVKIVARGGADPARFAEEAQTLAELDHPGIVRHLAHGTHVDGQLYLAMEWLDGEDLARRLDRGPLDVAGSLAVARGAAAALAQAHARGILHRDVKPPNLFLRGGDPERVVLLDFGVARPLARAQALTRSGAAVGTAGYMAPEQAAGARDLDPRCDVFAVGCVLFECLTGRPAFIAAHGAATLAKVMRATPPRVRDLVPTVPAALDELVARMLAKARAERPADGAALAAALEGLEERPEAEAAPRAPAPAGPVSVILGSRLDAEAAARLAGVARGFGGSATVLADATLLVTLPGDAADCAAALRDADPGGRFALGRGSGGDSGADPVDAAIDRAADGLLDTPGDALTLPVVERERYRIDREIARGGMGRILAAEDLVLRRTVALKELLIRWSPELSRRFAREVAITARLSHPAIVAVHEAGRWPSGEPFFAMRLVPGRSLADAIAAAATLDERLALLPHAAGAVEALAYAHSQGVVHRDLKPANILVGAYGETVVIDWGLAKDLARREAPGPGSATAPGAAGGAITVFGSVLGTPAYMPPEQAAGDDVDERADVYSLGAILYHLLAGAPPHAGDSGSELLERARRAEPPPLASVAPGAPRDLLTLVAKAMERDPARRYPSAVALAEDLRRFQTGRLVGAHRYTLAQLARRFVRRNRAAVAVAAVLVTLLAGLSAYGVRRIFGERDVAVDQRRAAERLVGFVVSDLYKQLDALGKSDMLRETSAEIVRYYRQLAAAVPDLEHDSLDRWARALELAGTASHTHADDEAARRQLGLALALRLALVAARPDDHEQRRAAARLQNGAGILLKQRDRDAALAAFQSARAILDPIAAEAESGWQLSSVLLELGEQVAERGRSDEAIGYYRRALALRQASAQDDDDQLGVSKAQLRLAGALADRGELAGALALYRQARDLRLGLAGAHPDNTDMVKGLSFAHGKVAAHLLLMGDVAAAQAEQEQGLAVSRRLAAYDPGDRSYRQYVAFDEGTLAEIMLKRGDLDGAAAHQAICLQMTEALAAADSGNLLLLGNLATAHGTMGKILLRRRELAPAVAEQRACERIALTLVARDANERLLLARCREGLGDALAASKDDAGALAVYRDALAVVEAAAAGDPSAVLRSRMATDLDRIAGVRQRQEGGGDEAEALRARARALLTELQELGQLDAPGRELLARLAAGGAR